MFSADQIADIQGFNKVYQNLLKQIDSAILETGYTLTEKDVLLEISKTERCTANILIHQLNIDRSYIDSPFPRENRKILISREVSSRYNRRGLGEYRKIAQYIDQIVHKKAGNYMIFFPSYQMMEAVYETYREILPEDDDVCYRVQSSGMNEAEREEFLDGFRRRDAATVGFCIMGGIFSEGIDLIGESLIGAVIVGTGIPGIGTEREILMKYYDKHDGNGFNYAYRYPGMNKVLQAAGRVIRTDRDKGVIVLLDDRFLTMEYRRMFPREWADYQICTLENTRSQLDDFWEGDS